ncbi:hypothetical protein BV25DRAFT_1922306 [Artomyces pyxidatus]|uniref:Uncharacterized protein n=1 Tax=Artomyces pyxidatus TaxID=48021 RepID=A0ACB8SF39_9AGAM|nr:hypothetical protein BV25DRAFT_1922306 [Artomyces pyxidatus]
MSPDTSFDDSATDQRHQSEGFPVQVGIDADYPAYIPPSSFNTTDIPGLHSEISTLEFVDSTATNYNLDPDQRVLAHQYNELATADKLMLSFIRSIAQSSVDAAVDRKLATITETLATIKELCQQAWTLTKVQVKLQKLLKILVRHYLIKPMRTYSAVAKVVSLHLTTKAPEYRLTLYTTDQTVRQAVDDAVVDHVTNARSTLRKEVFKATQNKTSLVVFARDIVDAFHAPSIPQIIPQNIMAHIALMRDVAAPLAKTHAQRQASSTSGQRGGDTGFWTALEDRLEDLYAKLGKDRTAEAWLQWEVDIIAKDKKLYARPRKAKKAIDREELDGMLSIESESSEASGSSHMQEAQVHEAVTEQQSDAGDQSSSVAESTGPSQGNAGDEDASGLSIESLGNVAASLG